MNRLRHTREIHPLDPQPHRYCMLASTASAPRVTRCSLGLYWSCDLCSKHALAGWGMWSYLDQIVRGSEIWWFITSAHSLSTSLRSYLPGASVSGLYLGGSVFSEQTLPFLLLRPLSLVLLLFSLRLLLKFLHLRLKKQENKYILTSSIWFLLNILVFIIKDILLSFM